MTDDKPAGLGHNLPPESTEVVPPKTIQEQLAEAHKALTDRYTELMELASAAPAEVKTEEVFAPLSDLLKAGRAYLAMSEAARKIENEESRKRTAMIDTWFKNPAERLTLAMKAVKERTDVYLDEKKASEEKRRKDEADRKAQAARDKAEDALWADARRELALYDAAKAEERATAERLRKEAAARRTDHLREHAKRLKGVEAYLAERAERRRLKAAAAAAAAIKAAADERARLEAEGEHRLAQEAADRRAEEEAARVEEARVRNAAELETAKKETQAARRAETKAAGQADTLFEAADDHGEEAEELGGAAARLGKRAERAERHANAAPADMSRTRSEMGTTSSITKTWKVTNIARDDLDLNMLRGFLHPDAVEVAVRGYMMAHRNDAGGPALKGATFEQVEEGVYR